MKNEALDIIYQHRYAELRAATSYSVRKIKGASQFIDDGIQNAYVSLRNRQAPFNATLGFIAGVARHNIQMFLAAQKVECAAGRSDALPLHKDAVTPSNKYRRRREEQALRRQKLSHDGQLSVCEYCGKAIRHVAIGQYYVWRQKRDPATDMPHSITCKKWPAAFDCGSYKYALQKLYPAAYPARVVGAAP